MNLNIEVALIVFCVLVVLILGHITRQLEIKIIQEKFFSLIIGLVLGFVLYIFHIP